MIIANFSFISDYCLALSTTLLNVKLQVCENAISINLSSCLGLLSVPCLLVGLVSV